MKPDQKDETDEPAPLAGDVIGDTAYSERFVLKILLKLANLDTLKDEIQEASFEEDLCTLWDMTTERDVVLFLQRHDVLNLFNFALPVIENPRIVEIIVGIIGNMCCQKEVVSALTKMDSFLTCLLEYIKSDDSLTLIQVLRLVSSCILLADNNDVNAWMQLFKKIEYSTAFYFILKNSCHKALIITALENFNTLCSYCNIDRFRTDFFTHFIKSEALDSLTTAFTEITVNKKDVCEKDEIERTLVLCLQITLNLVGFEKSLEIYVDSKENVTTMISLILNYYENKLVDQKDIDADLMDILDLTITIVKMLEISQDCDIKSYFTPSYNMWKVLCSITKSSNNGSSNFEEEDDKEFAKKIEDLLSTLMCSYMEKCSESALLQALHVIGDNYEIILGSAADKTMQTAVSKRASNYRTRLKENVDS